MLNTAAGWENIVELLESLISFHGDVNYKERWCEIFHSDIFRIRSDIMRSDFSFTRKLFSDMEDKLSGIDKEGQEKIRIFFYSYLILMMCKEKLLHGNLKGVLPLVYETIRQFVFSLNTANNCPPLNEDRGLILALTFCGKCIPLRTYWMHLSGIPRSVLLKTDKKDLYKVIKCLLFNMKGFKPVFELHLPKQPNVHLTESAIVEDYLLLVNILRVNHHVLGVYQANWYFDPMLKKISSHLEYLSNLATVGGAIIFKLGTDEGVITDATWKSRTRRKLFVEGKYMPMRYGRLWGRKDLLYWSETR